MKKIIKIQKVIKQGEVILTTTQLSKEALQHLLPYNKLYDKITVIGFKCISQELLTRLTNNYLHGAEITLQTKRFTKTYKLHYTPKPLYSYIWEELDLNAPIPRKLAEFEFEYQGVKTTYIKAIKTLTNTRFLPNEIWKALDEYSKERIKACKEYNKPDYETTEQWYKQLTKDLMPYGIAVYSPNEKTLYEATAELQFEKEVENYVLPSTLQPLTDKELEELHKWAPIYGVEIPTFKWHYNSRKTNHGYTQEPEVCLCGMSTTDWTRASYDARNEDNLPKFVRNGLVIKELNNDKLLRDAYIQVRWLRKNLKDEAFAPQYHRCPKCHDIYHENEGCKCGHCPSVIEEDNDNLFYGVNTNYSE